MIHFSLTENINWKYNMNEYRINVSPHLSFIRNDKYAYRNLSYDKNDNIFYITIWKPGFIDEEEYNKLKSETLQLFIPIGKNENYILATIPIKLTDDALYWIGHNKYNNKLSNGLCRCIPSECMNDILNKIHNLSIYYYNCIQKQEQIEIKLIHIRKHSYEIKLDLDLKCYNNIIKHIFNIEKSQKLCYYIFNIISNINIKNLYNSNKLISNIIKNVLFNLNSINNIYMV